MSDPSDIDESNEEVCGPFLWTIQTTSPTISKVAQEKKVRLIHRCGLALISTTTQETAIKTDKMRAKQKREVAHLAAKKQKEQEQLTAKKAKEEAKASNP